MAQVYRKLDVIGVRAVATSAVRDASNQHEFMEKASNALGTPVEIISGAEEARLIHLGVQARWPQPGKRVLMVDVGGGSAELILSEDGALAEAFSKPLGAVRLTEVFLKSDPPAPLELHRMNESIEEKLAAPLRRIGKSAVRPCDRHVGHRRGHCLRHQPRGTLAPRGSRPAEGFGSGNPQILPAGVASSIWPDAARSKASARAGRN